LGEGHATAPAEFALSLNHYSVADESKRGGDYEKNRYEETVHEGPTTSGGEGSDKEGTRWSFQWQMPNGVREKEELRKGGIW